MFIYCTCYYIQICVNVFLKLGQDEEDKDKLQQCLVYFQRNYTVEMLIDLIRASKKLNLDENWELVLYKADDDGELEPNQAALEYHKTIRHQGFINYYLKINRDVMSTPTDYKITRTTTPTIDETEEIGTDPTYRIVYSQAEMPNGYQVVQSRTLSHATTISSQGGDAANPEQRQGSCNNCVIL